MRLARKEYDFKDWYDIYFRSEIIMADMVTSG